jgi:hypothetical protein
MLSGVASIMASGAYSTLHANQIFISLLYPTCCQADASMPSLAFWTPGSMCVA